MSYCTIRNVFDLLSNAFTSGVTPPQQNGRQLLRDRDISENFRPNNVDSALVNQYIAWADNEIDGSLSEMYATPFCKKAIKEFALQSDINEYNSDIILSSCSESLSPGDVLLFVDDVQEEEVVVDEINGNVVSLESTLIGIYSTSDTRVVKISYPQPINLCSTRIAAANLFEKHFSAQVNPNISDYGKLQRELARQELNNILNGRTVLHGQKRIGHRFFNPNLRDRYRLPGVSDNDQSRNIETPNG